MKTWGELLSDAYSARDEYLFLAMQPIPTSELEVERYKRELFSLTKRTQISIKYLKKFWVTQIGTDRYYRMRDDIEVIGKRISKMLDEALKKPSLFREAEWFFSFRFREKTFYEAIDRYLFNIYRFDGIKWLKSEKTGRYSPALSVYAPSFKVKKRDAYLMDTAKE